MGGARMVLWIPLDDVPVTQIKAMPTLAELANFSDLPP